jgi:soluble lytic murein transglycosylase-like protein
LSLKALAICAFFHMQDNKALDIKPETVELICQNAQLIVDYSAKNQLNPELILSLMWSESRFEPHTVSHHGACGMMQIIPKWSDNLTCAQLQIPIINIAEGTRQLNFWINDYGKGSTQQGLCAYAAGYKCKVSTKAKKYAKNVIHRSDQLRQKLNKVMMLIAKNHSFRQVLIQKYKL